MKQVLTVTAFAGALAATATAGVISIEPTAPVMDTTGGGFEKARKPMTNPTMFDLAVPTTNVHPIVMYHRLPSSVTTVGAGNQPMGGHVEVYALQFEVAFSERLSLVATKDGYVRFKPDAGTLWNTKNGFANIAAGLKYAFIYDPASQTAVSGTATYEFPTGNHDVYQGEGEGGVLNLILSGVKLWDDFQLAGAAGVRLPFDGQLSTNSFVSAHASYEVTPWFIPLVEVNWHHVLSAGNGRPNYSGQASSLTPVVASFEGSDLLNFGASNATHNRDLVTAAVGFRSRITDSVNVGFAYELPLTDADDGVMKDRFTLDLVWSF